MNMPDEALRDPKTAHLFLLEVDERHRRLAVDWAAEDDEVVVEFAIIVRDMMQLEEARRLNRIH